MFKLLCWLIAIAVASGPIAADARPALAQSSITCRPAARDGSGFGLESRVASGRVSLCGDVLVKVKPAPEVPKVAPNPAPVIVPKALAKPIAKPVSPIKHPRGWVNRWSSTIVVRPLPLRARLLGARLNAGRLVASVSSSASVHYKRGWLLGRPVVVRFTPASWLWRVDHRPRHGRKVLRVVAASRAIHSAVSVVGYRVDVRLADSSTWMRQQGRITLESKPVWFGLARSVQAAPATKRVTFFVNSDCRQRPGGPGC